MTRVGRIDTDQISENRFDPWYPWAIFVGLLIVLSLASMARKSPVVDEGAHIAAGYSYLKLGDYRLNPEHPPLLKLIAATPLLLLPARIDAQDPAWQLGDQWAFAYRFFYQWNDANRVLYWARVPVVMLSALLGLAVGACAASLFGRAAGWTALGLYVINPDLLAHGQLVTTDLAVSCFMFLTIWAGWRALRCLTPLNLLLTGAAAGLALVAKFSGVLVLPMLMIVGIAYALTEGPMTVGLTGGRGRSVSVASAGGRLLAAGVVTAAAALLGLAVVWAVYGFRYHASPDPRAWRAFDAEITSVTGREDYRARLGALLDLPLLARRAKLLPEAYLHGFMFVVRWSKRPAFLMGEVSEQGWRRYFLVTFLVKTPIPLVLLVGMGLALRREWWRDVPGLLMLGLPVVFYWGVALLQPINIGHRHLLPIYPFLIVMAARSARVWGGARRRCQRLVIAAWVALLAWGVIAAAKIYPDYLAYFNEVAGGPRGGYRWLVDSNLDWGQDLPALAAYEQGHAPGELYLHYFGFGDPGYYGVRARPLREELRRAGGVLPAGATVAVSATRLQCVLRDDREDEQIRGLMARLRALTPSDWVGYSILVYRLP